MQPHRRLRGVEGGEERAVGRWRARQVQPGAAACSLLLQHRVLGTRNDCVGYDSRLERAAERVHVTAERHVPVKRLVCRRRRRVHPFEQHLRQRVLKLIDLRLRERALARQRAGVEVIGIEGDLVPDEGRVRGSVVPRGQQRRETPREPAAATSIDTRSPCATPRGPRARAARRPSSSCGTRSEPSPSCTTSVRSQYPSLSVRTRRRTSSPPEAHA